MNKANLFLYVSINSDGIDAAGTMMGMIMRIRKSRM